MAISDRALALGRSGSSGFVAMAAHHKGFLQQQQQQQPLMQAARLELSECCSDGRQHRLTALVAGKLAPARSRLPLAVNLLDS